MRFCCYCGKALLAEAWSSDEAEQYAIQAEDARRAIESEGYSHRQTEARREPDALTEGKKYLEREGLR